MKQRQSQSDRLTHDILEMIRTEQFAAGSRLPALPALAERFAVATPTLRESIRRLQAVGAVDIRHGSGVYVRDPAQRILVSNPYAGALNARLILDLLDARLVIEPQLARLAAERAEDRTLDPIADTLSRAEQALTGQDTLLSELNMEFHRALARLAGNAVLQQTVDSLLDVYENERMVILQLFDNREGDHAEHCSIFAAVRERRPALAAVRMRRHLAVVREAIAERLPRDT